MAYDGMLIPAGPDILLLFRCCFAVGCLQVHEIFSQQANEKFPWALIDLKN